MMVEACVIFSGEQTSVSFLWEARHVSSKMRLTATYLDVVRQRLEASYAVLARVHACLLGQGRALAFHRGFGLSFVPVASTGATRAYHLSDSWYEQQTDTLKEHLDRMLSYAQRHLGTSADAGRPRILVCPHASLFYSGWCAASAYQTLVPFALSYTRVIVLSPSHHTALSSGLVYSNTYDTYRTPLGPLAVDTSTLAEWQTQLPRDVLRASERYDQANNIEHAIEIQLPFLQRVLPRLRLVVPLAVARFRHDKDMDRVSQLLEKDLATHPDTLLVISSDLTHYGASFQFTPFQGQHDERTRIKDLDSSVVRALSSSPSSSSDGKRISTNACGAHALELLLRMLSVSASTRLSQLTCYYTSNDVELNTEPSDGQLVASGWNRTTPVPHQVSYAAVVFRELATSPALTFAEEQQRRWTDYERLSMLAMVRQTLWEWLRAHPTAWESDRKPSGYFKPQATLIPSANTLQELGIFVSVYSKSKSTRGVQRPRLRGCIGTYAEGAGPMPLYQTVVEYALAAAFEDPRFQNDGITLEELLTPGALEYEITILSPRRRIVDPLREFVRGRHGLTVHDGHHHAVYLPQVPLEHGWTVEQTLAELYEKAHNGQTLRMAGLKLHQWLTQPQPQLEWFVFEGYVWKGPGV